MVVRMFGTSGSCRWPTKWAKVVTPPWSAPSVSTAMFWASPSSIDASSSLPMWTCASMSPGRTYCPRASSRRRAPGNVASGPTATIVSPSTATPPSSTPPAVTTRPFLITRSTVMVGGREYRAEAGAMVKTHAGDAWRARAPRRPSAADARRRPTVGTACQMTAAHLGISIEAETAMGEKRRWFTACTNRYSMAEQSPTYRTRQWTRSFIVVAVVAMGWFAADHLARMDGRFFGPSSPAIRALAHYFVGDYGGAARLYRDALRLGTTMLPAEPAPSWSLFARGQLEEAEVQARMESRAVPTDPEPFLTLAEIALARRDHVTALAEAGRVLTLRRDDYDALLIIAVAQARQGAHEAANGALGRALRYNRVERRLTVFLAVLEAAGEL